MLHCELGHGNRRKGTSTSITHLMSWNVSSVPKRPVRPSLAWDGTDAKFETFGRDGRPVAVRPDLCPGRTAGPYRCLSLCFIFEFHEH